MNIREFFVEGPTVVTKSHDDLSQFPATVEGAQAIMSTVREDIIKMWRSERHSSSTDDLVAVINAGANQLKLLNREAVWGSVKQFAPELDLLPYLDSKPEARYGTVRIWAFIRFGTGRMCLIPMTLAYS